jgi:hypothetical protein
MNQGAKSLITVKLLDVNCDSRMAVHEPGSCAKIPHVKLLQPSNILYIVETAIINVVIIINSVVVVVVVKSMCPACES